MKKFINKMRGGGEQKTLKGKLLREICWSSGMTFIGIYAVYWVNRAFGMTEIGSLFLIGSFGATAVLLYCAPASDYSQPRNVVGGHFVSALAGVLMYKFFPENFALSCALAASVAIAGMYITRTMHPPGGATAMITIINPNAHALGFVFAFVPVLMGALIMLLIAILMNNLSSDPERRYPRYWF